MSSDYTIPALQRGIRVIEAAVSEEKGLSAAEFEALLDIPKTTLFRILRTLEKAGWLEKRGERYSAGFRIIQAGMLALSKIELRKRALPYLDRLSRETGETSHLGLLSGKRVLIAEVCDGPRHIKIASRPGSLTLPHCSSVGKVMLAYTHEGELEDFFEGLPLEKRTENTITELSRLKEELKTVRERGYALDNAEYYPDVRCLAAPVRDAFGKVIAAVGVTATTMSFKKSMIGAVAARVMGIADEISRNLGAGPGA